MKLIAALLLALALALPASAAEKSKRAKAPARNAPLTALDSGAPLSGPRTKGAAGQLMGAGALCVQGGGYPWATGQCLNSPDLNAAFNGSIGPNPPPNAGRGKPWLDTHVSPPAFRVCANEDGCGTGYVPTDWYGAGNLLAGGVNGLSVMDGPLTELVLNEAVTGTVAQRLVKIDATGHAVVSTTADIAGILGICVSNCSTVDSAVVSISGLVNCQFDGGATIGHYVVPSDVEDGMCHDAGVVPTDQTRQIIGRVRSATLGGDVYTVGVSGSAVASAQTFLSAGQLFAANNLSDLPDPAAARSNLGLGSSATQDVPTAAVLGGSGALFVPLSLTPPLSISGGSLGCSLFTSGNIGCVPAYGASVSTDVLHPTGWGSVSVPGGALTPGGAIGSIQYNLDGSALAGFTMSGDCTTVVGTGVITCTRSNNVLFAPSATTDATNANNINSGTMSGARLPLPQALVLGSAFSLAANTNGFLTGLGTDGNLTRRQPAAADITGLGALAPLGAGTNLSIGGGLLNVVPNPSLGTNASVAGTLGLANGNASGATVTVQNPGTTVAYNYNLPTTAGAVGECQVSGGGGSAPMYFVPCAGGLTTPGSIVPGDLVTWGADNAHISDGGLLPLSPPGGRLSPSTGLPIQSVASVTATTLYYVPFVSQRVPIYNGTVWQYYSVGAQLSLALDSNSGHTGYHQNGKNFDLFLALNAGSPVLCTGPAWTSDSARGTGAGTTQEGTQNGIKVNAQSITCRIGNLTGDTITVAAGQGTRVGSFRATANGSTTQRLAGVVSLQRTIYNDYWRQRYNGNIAPAGTGTFSVTAGVTWQDCGGGGYDVTILDGSGTDDLKADFQSNAKVASNANVIRIGIDDLGAGIPSAWAQASGSSAVTTPLFSKARATPSLGWHGLKCFMYSTSTSDTFNQGGGEAIFNADFQI